MTSAKEGSKDLEYIRLYRASYLAEKCSDSGGRTERVVIMRMIRSMVTFAKVSLFFLNLYVAAVVLVVVMGHWRIFESQDPNRRYDDSHLIVMRELKEEDGRKPAFLSNSSNQVDSRTNIRNGMTTLSPFLKERDDRVQTMTHWCSKLKPRAPDPSTITEDKLGQMLVDDKHKFLYCQIPGVAQTDWRRILVFLTGQVKVASHLKISGSDVHSKYGKYLKKLSDFPPAERKKRIQNYFKVMFVREPMERLVSSYKSKFEAKYSKYFHQSFGRKIVKKYRKKPTKESLQKGSDVTFSEFIQFVIDSEHSEENLNEHWQQYYKQCHPCLVSYDFIGKYETLNDDVNHVLEKINAAQKIKGPLGTSNFTYQEKLLKTMYKSVSPKNLQRLWKIYYPDYNLFSYPYPSVLDNLLDFQGIP
ncbi:carbohydrate sulfotransferase 11-like isoform X2 [Haliotis rufescens]|uniref:carbohydrate sulfotransferase 11-like isoform X2 n=1 Tax=Haliotis rufescens TaxID=6454 RepID=UPI00201E9789|nr:carbohydrate sulfotransferase 11-like isoform X2 [Haliotis rufescens]